MEISKPDTYRIVLPKINVAAKATLPIKIIALIVWLSCAWSLDVFSQENSGSETIVLDQFERLYIDGESSPPNHIDVGWEQVTLKDIWLLKRRQQHLEAWYRTDILLPTTQEELSLYLPRIATNASIWLNGVEIGNTGSFESPLSNNWNYPVFVDLPKQLIREGNNQLAIRLKVSPGHTGLLFEMYIDTKIVLEPRYNKSYFLKITATKILSSVMVIAVVILLVFYFSTSLSISYLWFSFGTAAWVIFSLFFVVKDPPILRSDWDSVASLSLFTAAFFYTKCIRHIFSLSGAIPARILLGLFVLQVLGVLALPLVWLSVLHIVYLFISVLVIFVLAISVGLRSIKMNGEYQFWLALTSISVLFLIGFDLVAITMRWTTDFAKFIYVPVVAMVGGVSVFVRQLIQSENENRILKNQQGDIESAARSDAVKNERKRLMQEIHDGVGGQLVSTLTRLEKNHTADSDLVDSLRGSIDDLRLIVHSLESVSQQQDVTTILATIRERMEKGLQAQGIRIDWQVQKLPKIDNFDSDHALHLMRIVQESIANTIKHSGAKCIRFSCASLQRGQQNGVVIQISDDGKGFSTDSQPVGLGLKNMQDRAKKLNAQLSIQSSTQLSQAGTTIELWIPLNSKFLP